MPISFSQVLSELLSRRKLSSRDVLVLSAFGNEGFDRLADVAISAQSSSRQIMNALYLMAGLTREACPTRRNILLDVCTRLIESDEVAVRSQAAVVACTLGILKERFMEFDVPAAARATLEPLLQKALELGLDLKSSPLIEKYLASALGRK